MSERFTAIALQVSPYKVPLALNYWATLLRSTITPISAVAEPVKPTSAGPNAPKAETLGSVARMFGPSCISELSSALRPVSTDDLADSSLLRGIAPFRGFLGTYVISAAFGTSNALARSLVLQKEDHMQKAITVRETFASRVNAEQARERLEDCGFARNSMNIIRAGSDFELAIRTRPENADRVQGCIESSGLMEEARLYSTEMRGYTPSVAQSIVLVGALAALGGGLYYAYTRQREIGLRYPAGQRKAVQSLYRAHRAPLEHSSKTDCDLPENSKESLDQKLDHALTETFPTSDPVSVSITR
jgi:hypothetical protein